MQGILSLRTKIPWVIIGCFLFQETLFPSDNSSAPKVGTLVHEHKVYRDPNGLIYWPMDMPVWIRLATSPREDAPSFLLKNIYQEDASVSEQYVNNGIKLEIPGRQFVRWMNYLTEDEDLYKFMADGAPPRTELGLFQAPRSVRGETVFYGKGLKARLGSQDDLSGVEQILISIDGKAYVPLEKTLSLNQEKRYDLAFYAVDRVGYTESPKTSSFIVDLTPPQSSHQTEKNLLEDTLSRESVILLSSLDTLAGVDFISYRFDNGTDFMRYDRAVGIRMEGLSDGKHVLQYRGTDRVRNVEIEKEYRFHLDLTPPRVAYQVIGDLYLEDMRSYVSSRSRIKLQADDLQVPLKQIKYRINDSSPKTYISPFLPPIQPGRFMIRFTAIDQLRNRAPEQLLELFMDLEPPTTRMHLIGPNFSQGSGVIWATGRTRIKLKSFDNISGLKQIKYQLGEEAVQVYERPFSVPKTGQYLFRYWAIDRVNNREMFKPLLLMVDESPPQILEVFSINSIGTETTKEGAEIPVYPQHTTLFLNAMDNSASIKGIWYQLNGDDMKEYTQVLFLDQPGRYRITIKAEDQLGNVSVKTLEFMIAQATE